MSKRIDSKVAAGGLAGAAAAALIGLWNMVFPNNPIPAEEAATLAVLISFIAGYLKRTYAPRATEDS